MLNINKTYLNETTYTQKRKDNHVIKYLIIHHTAGFFNSDIAIFRWHTSRWVSIHYYISKLWVIYQFLDDNMIWYHTWLSDKWPQENIFWWGWNLNPISIWIELENLGDWKDEYTKEQIKSLEELSIDLLNRHNIEIQNVLWHKEITKRKIDPSSNFYENDMEWFRNFLDNKINWTQDTQEIQEENKENKYKNIPWFEIFEDMTDNYEIKKLIEIWLYRAAQLSKEKKLKIRK